MIQKRRVKAKLQGDGIEATKCNEVSAKYMAQDQLAARRELLALATTWAVGPLELQLPCRPLGISLCKPENS